jgi:hypothetical protein
VSIQKQVAAWLGFDTAKCSWPPPRLSIGLQGGGSFGVFAWGVLDRLLEEDRLAIDALSVPVPGQSTLYCSPRD